MARLFDDGSSEYLNYAGAIVSGAPLTMACLFNSDDVASLQAGISINDGGNNFFTMQFEGDRGVDTIRGFVKSTTVGVQAARSTTAYSANTLHHGAFIAASPTSRTIYLDAGGVGTSTVDCTPLGLDATQIGAHKTGDYMSGSLAEVGIWNVALTLAEVAILASHYSPLFVRPQNLVAYYKLIRDEDQDIVGGYDMTPVNTPSIAVHPPMIYPAPPHIAHISAGAPPATIVPLAMHHYRSMRV